MPGVDSPEKRYQPSNSPASPDGSGLLQADSMEALAVRAYLERPNEEKGIATGAGRRERGSALRTALGRVSSFLPQGAFGRGVATMAGGTALGQGLVILASPVLTRLYSPEEMGLFGLFTAFVGFAGVGLCLRYEAAIASASSQEEADSLVMISAALCVPTSLLAAGALAALSAWGVLGFGALPAIAGWMVLPALFFTGVWTALRYHYVRRQQLRRTAESTVAQNAGRAAVPIALAPLTPGWLGLAAGEVLGRGLGVLWLIRGSGLRTENWRRLREAQKISALFRKYRSFPFLVLPSSALDALALALPVPLIAALYGADAAGLYALVQRVLAVPAGLVGRSVADAFHGQAASHAREAPGLVRPFLLRVAGRLAWVAAPPALVLVLVGPEVFRWVFGTPWFAAGGLAAVMAPWVFAQIVVGPLTPLVFVLGGQRSKLVYDFTAVAVTAVSLHGGHVLGLSLVGSVGLLAAGHTLAYGIYFLVLLRLASGAAPRGN